MSSLYVWPLFEVTRRYLLDAAEDGEVEVETVNLWNGMSLAPEDYLPADIDPAPYERRVMEDALAPLDDPELDQAFETYQHTDPRARRGPRRGGRPMARGRRTPERARGEGCSRSR